MATTLLRRLLPALAVALFAGTSGAADAGWVTLKNNTDRVVVVQETVDANGHPKRCKPVRLLPGECVHEFQPAAVVKLEVFDGQNPGRSLYRGDLAIKPERQTFAVGVEGAKVVVNPVRRADR